MLLHKRDLDKVRMGLAKCPSCGEFYNPTYGPCPYCTKRYNIATITFAIVVLMFLLFWLPLEGAAKAQADPEPTAHCWVDPDGSPRCLAPAVTAQVTPTTTPILSPPFEPTDTPTPLPTPTNTRRPTATPSMSPVIIPIPQHYVWLPVVRK